jgi:UDP-N-acetylglucosamine--N-acetylmuramyl-(pentapeptide) pyrophosphoryl-undecaprenol N-acetylglucosamine transferase
VRLLLTGGGTGGHIYPALAIAEALAQREELKPLEVLFVGNRRGLEAQIVPKAGLRSEFIHSAPLVRKLSFGLLRTVVANVAGFFEALAVLHRFRPQIVIATGGYVTLPLIAALRVVRFLHLSRARIALLEPNAAPGLTNRFLGPLADEIWLTVAEPGRALGKKEIVTGTPVRASFLRPLSAQAARASLGLDPGLMTIVVFGGSQGARSVNDAVAGLGTLGLPAAWQLLLVSGARDFAASSAQLRAAPHPERLQAIGYLDDPRAAYAAADLVVARAGASTLGELAATGTPALLVPYPHATDDHQARNAEVMRAAGAARVLADRELSATRLRVELEAALASDTLGALRRSAQVLAASDPCAAIAARVNRWAREKTGSR